MTRLFEAKPWIIAEIGSNWHNLTDALESISVAAKCGADAVKFQAYDAKSLYGHESLMQLTGQLPLEWLPQLKEKADACGVEFMCTAFSESLLDVVDPYVSVHKIASSDNLHVELLRKAFSKGKPVIISCGASGMGDIGALYLWLTGNAKNQQVVLMYCNASYPSYAHNLFDIDKMKPFGLPVGFSDHSPDVVYAPLSAHKHFGVVAIEKHFKLDRVTGTPDAPHSLDQGQFKTMVEFIRGQRDQFGSSEEKEFYQRHNRRAIATQDIGEGQALRYGQNFGYYRTLSGSPKGFSPINGRVFDGLPVKRSFRAGECIDIGDLYQEIK